MHSAELFFKKKVRKILSYLVPNLSPTPNSYILLKQLL